MPSRCTIELALLAAALMLAAPGCKDDESSPTGPTPIAGNGPTVVAGATQVRGTERLSWNQSGDFTKLRFRAYVDDRPVDLPSTTCTRADPEAECSSPLPALTDGVHTLALATVAASGVESTRSAPMTLQKGAARATV